MSTTAHHYDVAVVGSGFAGSVLARLLALAGRSVLLVEKGRHPRFALGESSTPLAAIALERLARQPGCEDLAALAAAGRWRRQLEHLGRGLKRGFTFYAHRPGVPYANSAANDARLLVAASPDDAVADNHWLRADVDHHLALHAADAGAELVEGCELGSVALGDDAVALGGRRDDGAPFHATAAFVVDASGPGGFLARHLPIAAVDPGVPDTALLYGHFHGVAPFAETARATGATLAAGPYPDDRAAVHHLLDEGWTYALHFDRPAELASVGCVLRRGAADRLHRSHPDPAAGFHALLARYPTLAASFAAATAVEGPRWAVPLARRLARTHGRRWLLLPHAHAFFDPLFSTGIAWSLLGVERAAELLAGGTPAEEDLERYGRLLAAEADHLARLVAGAWRAMDDFATFTAWSMLYFVAASFCETTQRLTAGDHCRAGFLGATDPVLAPVVEEAGARLGEPGFTDWLRTTLATRNVAGLLDPARHNLYPVDLDALVAAAGVFGMTADEMRAALPRLRGNP